MLDDARMTIASRCHQHPVRHLPAIVEDRVARKRGHVTIRFLHDQIGRGKVPVAALAAGKGGIEPPSRDPAQPQRQRADPRMKRQVVRRPAQPFDQRLRPGDAGKIQIGARRGAKRHAVAAWRPARARQRRTHRWPARIPPPAPATRPRPAPR